MTLLSLSSLLIRPLFRCVAFTYNLTLRAKRLRLYELSNARVFCPLSRYHFAEAFDLNLTSLTAFVTPLSVDCLRLLAGYSIIRELNKCLNGHCEIFGIFKTVYFKALNQIVLHTLLHLLAIPRLNSRTSIRTVMEESSSLFDCLALGD